MDSREQKNFFRKKLEKLFPGEVDIETSMKFINTKLIDRNSKDYVKIVTALKKYRGKVQFTNTIGPIECDFVIEKEKLIFEYDERQHFSKARLLSLQQYPKEIKTFFNKNKWIEQCREINAIDNDPHDRDERRAYRDSVRDIEAFRNGWHLIRFYHGEIDWSLEESITYLKQGINAAQKVKLESRSRVFRLAVTKPSQFDTTKNSRPQYKACAAMMQIAAKKFDHSSYDYFVTPGGFLQFAWPKNVPERLKNISIFHQEVNDTIAKFYEMLNAGTRKIFNERVKYITFGIDSYHYPNPDEWKVDKKVELVALFDVKRRKVVHLTGKSYPTTGDISDGIILEEDLRTHFVKVDDDSLCLLGCHDLNLFSPRASAKAGKERQIKIDAFKALMNKHKPNIVLQHPHTTDTYKIWNQAWKTLEKDFPFVKEYASGICYYINGKRVRGTRKEVEQRTIKGSVTTVFV